MIIKSEDRALELCPVLSTDNITALLMRTQVLMTAEGGPLRDIYWGLGFCSWHLESSCVPAPLPLSIKVFVATLGRKA